MVTLSKEDKVECIRSNNSLHHAGSNPVPTTKYSCNKYRGRNASLRFRDVWVVTLPLKIKVNVL